jgi:UDP-hydrolysing UDP-N-acetyl-D-glucosamine 2-epimerase
MTLTEARRVAVVTGSRADYGLLRPTIAALHADPRFEVSLLVCAMHLSARFGRTVEEIERDGFPIAARIETAPEDDGPGAHGRRLALAIDGFTRTMVDDRPDVLLLLGDRYEMLGAALAASGLGVAVAHMHGGELSEGSLDDAMRHSITKLAHLHLVAARPYGERVCQLGERPEAVRVVGAAGIEAIRTLEALTRKELSAELGLGGLGSPLIVVTFHPESLQPYAAGTQIQEVVGALETLASDGATLIVTLPNDDPGSAPVRDALLEFASRTIRAHAFDSLGQRRYLSLLAHADLMLGNSSSGLLEAPAFGLPVVNVGDRQRGRLVVEGVLSCAVERETILLTARRALDPGFRAALAGGPGPFGSGRVSEAVVSALAELEIGEQTCPKRFLDLPNAPWRDELGLGEPP